MKISQKVVRLEMAQLQVPAIVKKCIDYFKADNQNGARFAEHYGGPQFLEET